MLVLFFSLHSVLHAICQSSQGQIYLTDAEQKVSLQTLLTRTLSITRFRPHVVVCEILTMLFFAANHHLEVLLALVVDQQVFAFVPNRNETSNCTMTHLRVHPQSHLTQVSHVVMHTQNSLTARTQTVTLCIHSTNTQPNTSQSSRTHPYIHTHTHTGTSAPRGRPPAPSTTSNVSGSGKTTTTSNRPGSAGGTSSAQSNASAVGS